MKKTSDKQARSELMVKILPSTIDKCKPEDVVYVNRVVLKSKMIKLQRQDNHADYIETVNHIREILLRDNKNKKLVIPPIFVQMDSGSIKKYIPEYRELSAGAFSIKKKEL